MRTNLLLILAMVTACFDEPAGDDGGSTDSAYLQLNWTVRRDNSSVSCATVGASALRATYERDDAQYTEYFDCDEKSGESQALPLGNYRVQLILEDSSGGVLRKRELMVSLLQPGQVELPETIFGFDRTKLGHYRTQVHFYDPLTMLELECSDCQVELTAENLATERASEQRFDCEWHSSSGAGGYVFYFKDLALGGYRVSVTRVLGPDLWPIPWTAPNPIIGDELVEEDETVRLPTFYVALPTN